MVKPESQKKQLIASLHIMTACRGSEEIHLYEKSLRGILKHEIFWVHNEKQVQQKLIDLKPEAMAILKSKMDFKSPRALEPHCMGCDGVTYDLLIYKDEQERKYSWWLYAPKGWESVVNAANALLGAAELNDRTEISPYG